MWGFYCDIETNNLISEPFEFIMMSNNNCLEPSVEYLNDPKLRNISPHSTMYYIGMMLILASLIQFMLQQRMH